MWAGSEAEQTHSTIAECRCARAIMSRGSRGAGPAGDGLRLAMVRGRQSSLGLMPLLSLVAVTGLLAVAAANLAAQVGAWWSEIAFYGGLLVIVIPIAVRLLSTRPGNQERIALVVLLALALFACKLIRDPIHFGAYDEFLHWRTAEDMVLTGTVFSPNTLLGVSPYYPGLELVTTALSETGGIPIFEAGSITLAFGRLVFMLALFLFFEMASGSGRVAGIASLVYMTNPKFLYFNSQFAYESLALPLAAVVLFLLVRRGHSQPAGWLGLTVILLVTIPSIVITHHVTSAMLSIFLILWGIVAMFLGRRDSTRAKPGRIAVLTVALIAAWTLLVATATIGYLGPAVTSTFTEMLRLIGGELEPRTLFESRGGDVAPLWERLTGSASAGLIVLLLPLGLLTVWSRYRSSAIVLALALVAMAYPATLLARFTRVGAEVATRTPEFIFLGIGLVVALTLARFSFRGRLGLLQSASAAGVIAVLAIGGVLVGVAPWARLPGPYLVAADARSVEPEGIAAATWAREVLGPGQRIVADRVNRILMSSYGQQTMIVTYETRLPVRRLYLTQEIGPIHRDIVRNGQIRYLVADRRLTTGLPVVGHYFDRGEESIIGRRETPLEPVLLDKFDRLPEVSRVFDSGNIRIYDIRALAEDVTVAGED
jgi:hypothetical protein